MTKIELPKSFNYIGMFLTFSCNMGCSYCINRYSTLKAIAPLDYKKLIKGLLRIQTRDDLPITLCGGEPTVHSHFYSIVNTLHKEGKTLDLLTNGMFDFATFKKKVKPGTFSRKAKYASIRISLHQTTDMYKMVLLARSLMYCGHTVGIWGIDRPDFKEKNEKCKELCNRFRIDFRLKEFLGIYKGRLYGTYKYTNAVHKEVTQEVNCKPSELLIAPDGYVYSCHANLYAHRNDTCNIMDNVISNLDNYHYCTQFGKCNPCDIKTKFNRFQEEGHCAVEIFEAPTRKYGCKY
jgi:sulfatase maturation enzyme AslB (radical SAM superfamily)